MVLIVNTSERTGGAAVAANRLMKALNKNGIDAEMLVADKNTSDVHVFDIPGKLRKKYNFIFERLLILVRNKFSKKRLFEIDPAFTGTDITKLPCFKKADVIHLHWINQGMLSMRNLRKIIRSGKKIVWTMHDQWCSTGICHSTGDCLKFQTHCAACPVLQTSRRKDLAWRTFVKKKTVRRPKHHFRHLQPVAEAHRLHRRVVRKPARHRHPQSHRHRPLQAHGQNRLPARR